MEHLLRNSLMKKNKLSDLSIFFCFFNDAGTVLPAISQAFEIGGEVAQKLEVIAIHGGPSSDETWQTIIRAKKCFPKLKAIDCSHNKEGYAVIKKGFAAAKYEWVFYTDGDLQYYVEDLRNLVAMQFQTDADVINGYKTQRGDGWQRVWGGEIYRIFTRFLFQFPIRDLDCDFRLIRASKLRQTNLTATHASILADLISQLQKVGATFAEVPVRHRARQYGQSNYSLKKLFTEKILGDLLIYQKMKSH